MKINMPELAHYLIGSALLMAAWIPIMTYFKNDLVLTGITWTLWYIVMDQFLHVVVKGEKINIVK